jgi:hypothetical protein
MQLRLPLSGVLALCEFVLAHNDMRVAYSIPSSFRLYMVILVVSSVSVNHHSHAISSLEARLIVILLLL